MPNWVIWWLLGLFRGYYSMFGGIITDTLGRKKTVFIFDLIAWPVSILVYMFSNSFWLFALAVLLNNAVKISSVAWNMMIVEDADNVQQTSAYNIINAINISAGILTYALYNTLVSIMTAAAGLVTGLLFGVWPGFIYLLSFIILLTCVGLLIIFQKQSYYPQKETIDTI
jgi:MFS family permease